MRESSISTGWAFRVQRFSSIDWVQSSQGSGRSLIVHSPGVNVVGSTEGGACGERAKATMSLDLVLETGWAATGKVSANSVVSAKMHVELEDFW